MLGYEGLSNLCASSQSSALIAPISSSAPRSLRESGDQLRGSRIGVIWNVVPSGATAELSDGQISLRTVTRSGLCSSSLGAHIVCKSRSASLAAPARWAASRARACGGVCARPLMKGVGCPSDRLTSLSERIKRWTIGHPGLVACERFDQQGEARGGGLRLRPRTFGPVSRYGKRAAVGVAQAQCLDTRDAAGLQKDTPLSAQRMERVDDLSRSQRLVGSRCSSLRVCPRPATGSRRRWSNDISSRSRSLSSMVTLTGIAQPIRDRCAQVDRSALLAVRPGARRPMVLRQHRLGVPAQGGSSCGMAGPRGSSPMPGRPIMKPSCRVMLRVGGRTVQDAGSSRSGPSRVNISRHRAGSLRRQTRVRSMVGFKSADSARAILDGNELIHMPRK